MAGERELGIMGKIRVCCANERLMSCKKAFVGVTTGYRYLLFLLSVLLSRCLDVGLLASFSSSENFSCWFSLALSTVSELVSVRMTGVTSTRLSLHRGDAEDHGS